MRIISTKGWSSWPPTCRTSGTATGSSPRKNSPPSLPSASKEPATSSSAPATRYEPTYADFLGEQL
ncbi:hypothetical protein Q9Q99_10200 [Curtobacterium flaccumfaciens]|nr:hypothetical protein Q9Q99_10200 [Curtobacterium flaccumfaciens]